MDDQYEVTRSSGEDPEVIRQQMDETRSALSEKIGLLEQQVYDTVQGAAETVENVKQQVQETVESVTNRVRDTVSSVQENLDIRHHVEQRPWGMTLGALAIGAVVGYITAPEESPDDRAYRRMRNADWDTSNRGSRFVSQESHDSQYGNGASSATAAYSSPTPQRNYEPAASHHTETSSGPTLSSQAMQAATGFLGTFAESLQPSIDKLKGLAIGTALGVARDVVMSGLPESVSKEVSEVFDNMTTSLGGKPVRGNVFPKREGGSNRHEKAGGHEKANKDGQWHEQPTGAAS